MYYVEGLHGAILIPCTRPSWRFVGRNACVRYTTIQNWSNNVYNLVTSCQLVPRAPLMEWVDGNIGLQNATFLAPSVSLHGPLRRGEAPASRRRWDQHQDTGAKMIHMASANFRSHRLEVHCRRGAVQPTAALVKALKNARHSKSVLKTLLLVDDSCLTPTAPTTSMGHESPSPRISLLPHAAWLTETEAMAHRARLRRAHRP